MTEQKEVLDALVTRLEASLEKLEKSFLENESAEKNPSKILELEQEIATRNDEIAKLKNEAQLGIENLENRLKEVNNQLENMVNVNNGLVAQAASYAASIAKYESDLSTLTVQLKSTESEKSREGPSFQDEMATLVEIQKQTDLKLKSVMESEMWSKEQFIEQVKKTRTMQDELQDLKAELDSVMKEKTVLIEKMNSLVERKDVFKDKEPDQEGRYEVRLLTFAYCNIYSGLF